jgi:hypothetical protein
MATDGSLWPLLTVFWRSQKTSHHRHVCLSSDKFGLLHKLDFANGQLLSAGDWSNHCGDVHRLSKIMNMSNPLQIPLDFKTNPKRVSRVYAGWTVDWVNLAVPFCCGGKVGRFWLGLIRREKVFQCALLREADGNGPGGDWQFVWFSCLKLKGQHKLPTPHFFGSCCKGWPTVVFGMDVYNFIIFH